MGIEKHKENLEKLISKEKITQDDVELIFVKIRIILEKLNVKHKYPQLNFYCDWIVHSEINRPTKVVDLLLQLNQKIAIEYDMKKELHIHELIDPNQCWKEINSFLNDIFKNKNYSLNQTSWNTMFYDICIILSNRPLCLKENLDKRYNEKVNQIKNFKTSNNHLVGITSIEFEISEGNEYSPKGAILWVAKAQNDRITFKGQL